MPHVKEKPNAEIVEPAEQAPAPVKVEKPAAEPATVTVASGVLSEIMASFTFIMARLGAAYLSNEGRAAYLRILAVIADDGHVPADVFEIDAADAFWIARDLLGARGLARRQSPDGAEGALGAAIAGQVPKLAARLQASAAKLPSRPNKYAMPERPKIESPVEPPEHPKYPRGQYFDHNDRPTGLPVKR